MTSGCVGPTSPFGYVPLKDVSTKKNWQMPDLSYFNHGQTITPPAVKVTFNPDAQVLHDKMDLTVTVFDPDKIPSNYEFKIFHNGLDVTKILKRHAIFNLDKNKTTLNIAFKNLRFKTGIKNEIFVQYYRGSNLVISKFYQEPNCLLKQNRKIASIPQFDLSNDYLSLINDLAEDAQINPAILNGIVAQESGFNPQAVSYAKGVGLTQVTSLAEKEVISKFEHWPRYNGIDELNYLVLKSMITLGQVNSQNEWRLNPKLNIKGGLEYLNFLKNYWEKPQNIFLIKNLPGDFNVNFSRVVLSSYNSGAARTKSAIEEKGSHWENHEKLKEASRYIQKVSSYCYHFSRKF